MPDLTRAERVEAAASRVRDLLAAAVRNHPTPGSDGEALLSTWRDILHEALAARPAQGKEGSDG